MDTKPEIKVGDKARPVYQFATVTQVKKRLGLPDRVWLESWAFPYDADKLETEPLPGNSYQFYDRDEALVLGLREQATAIKGYDMSSDKQALLLEMAERLIGERLGTVAATDHWYRNAQILGKERGKERDKGEELLIAAQEERDTYKALKTELQKVIDGRNLEIEELKGQLSDTRDGRDHHKEAAQAAFKHRDAYIDALDVAKKALKRSRAQLKETEKRYAQSPEIKTQGRDPDLKRERDEAQAAVRGLKDKYRKLQDKSDGLESDLREANEQLSIAQEIQANSTEPDDGTREFEVESGGVGEIRNLRQAMERIAELEDELFLRMNCNDESKVRQALTLGRSDEGRVSTFTLFERWTSRVKELETELISWKGVCGLGPMTYADARASVANLIVLESRHRVAADRMKTERDSARARVKDVESELAHANTQRDFLSRELLDRNRRLAEVRFRIEDLESEAKPRPMADAPTDGTPIIIQDGPGEWLDWRWDGSLEAWSRTQTLTGRTRTHGGGGFRHWIPVPHKGKESCNA